MGRGERFSLSDDVQLHGLRAARAELNAARTLVLNLHDGEYPACIHLVRAASLLSRLAAGELGEAVLDGNALDVEPGEVAALPGLNAREREELKRHLGVVRRSAASLLGDGNGNGEEVERSVRAVCDLLEKVTLALRPRGGLGWLRFWRMPRVVWFTLGSLVVVVLVVLGVTARGPGQPQRSAPATRATTHATHPVDVALQELALPKAEGTPWDAPGTVRISSDGGTLRVRLGRLSRAREIEISLDNNDTYRIEFLHGARVAGNLSVGPTPDTAGLVIYRRKVPDAAVAEGFDTIRITPTKGDGAYSVGHLILDPPASAKGGEAGGQTGVNPR